MKRLAIATAVYPPEIGGPASYLPPFVAYAAEQAGIRLAVAQRSEVLPHPNLEVIRYRREYRVKYLDVLINETLLARAISRVAVGCDAVYLHGALWPYGLLADCGGRPSCRVIQKFTGYQPWEFFRAKNPGSQMMLEEFCSSTLNAGRIGPLVVALDRLARRSLAASDLVITPSRSLADNLERLGVDRERVRVIPNPVPLPPLPPVAAAPPRRSQPLLLITACRLVEHKGLDRLIDWVARRSDVRLKIVGDGPLRERLASRVAALGAENIALAGSASRAELHADIFRADLFVLNSEYEGFSHLLAEVAALGKNFAATDIPGNRDLVEVLEGTCGELYSPGDEAAFWASVERALARGSEIPERCREAVSRLLDPGAIFGRTLEVLLG